MTVKLFKGDCLELLKQIKDESIDLVLADLPFGMTNNQWDSVIPLAPLFEHYQRIIKPHGAVLLFGMGKFGAQLILSAPAKLPYRYDWIWEKTKSAGFLNAKKMPLRAHENVYVFYKRLPTYHPQKRYGFKPYSRTGDKSSSNYRSLPPSHSESKHGERFPIDVIKFSNPNNKTVHPTQKPVDLLRYLIKTYTNEGMTVLDNTMGSGSTGVACVNTGRNFIGMELSDKYFEIAERRIRQAQKDITLV